MRHRFFLTLIGAVAVAAPACNGADAGLGPTSIAYENEATDIVLEREYSSSWSEADQLWRAIPGLLVFGDGTVVVTIYDDDNEAPFDHYGARTINPAGMQALLSEARAAGLLGPLDLESEVANKILDGSAVSVTVRAAGGTFEHNAYMLGEEDALTVDRGRFAEFVTDLDDLSSMVGPANISSERPWTPEAYDIQARVDESGESTEILDWPVTDTDLARADCRLVLAEDLGSIPTTATADTRYRHETTVYEVWFGPWLPGRTRC